MTPSGPTGSDGSGICLIGLASPGYGTDATIHGIGLRIRLVDSEGSETDKATLESDTGTVQLARSVQWCEISTVN